MDIRYLTFEEKIKIKSLYLDCFDDSMHYVDFYVSQFMANTDTVAAIKDGQIISMASVHYKKLMLQGKYYDAGYIYGVATDKNHRNLGIMNEVIAYLNDSLMMRGIKIIYLVPAVAPDIYYSSGFRMLREKRTFNIYDQAMSEEYMSLEKSYKDAASMKTHLKELIATYKLGYVKYQVFPVMIYENDLTIELFGKTKEMALCGEDINIAIDDITTLNDIYGVFPNNEDV